MFNNVKNSGADRSADLYTKINKFMTYYLYKKTHNRTGLKYLGKTQSNPHTYRGSGVRWNNHLRIHGDDVSTEILCECETNDEIRYWGEYYSNLWDVVNSNEWANLKVESGDGGSYPHREETKSLISEIKRGLPAHNKGKKWSQERKDRQAGMNSKENNPMFGKVFVNNGVSNLTINKLDPIPTGYVLGAIQKTGNKKGRPGKTNPNFGKHWITDGVTNKMVDKQIAIPQGWYKGRIKI